MSVSPSTEGGGALVKSSSSALDRGAMIWVTLEVVVIILFLSVTDYGAQSYAGEAAAQLRVNKFYPFFQDVHVMIFIGFGFLMTFLRTYSFSSVGFNLLIGAFTVQWSILVGGFFHQLFAGKGFSIIELDVTSLIAGDFAAGAVLITMGALLGKASPTQLLLVAVFEVIFYAINEYIGVAIFSAVDMGGSMFIHSFGAYFGLAASFMLSPASAKDHKNNSSSYQSDMFAMVGTVFLWMFWPSFNGALAPGASQERVVVNTVLSLTGSACAAFISSRLIRGKKEISMVDVQNATLAGGVAIGSSTDMVISPGAAVLVGAAAGCLSVVGYTKISPWLERKIGLQDTCGIHNLHGMPGVLGGIIGAISASTAVNSKYADLSQVFPESANGRTMDEQAGMQAAALGVTLVISLVGGAITGALVRKVEPTPENELFSDASNWETPDDFDKQV